MPSVKRFLKGFFTCILAILLFSCFLHCTPESSEILTGGSSSILVDSATDESGETGETELESGTTVASIPVTIAKAEKGYIDALGISFGTADDSEETITAGMKFTLIGKAWAAEETAEKCFLKGEPETVEAGAELTLVDADTDEGEAFTAREDGSFVYKIPPLLLRSSKMLLRHANENELETPTRLHLDVSLDCQHYIIGISFENDIKKQSLMVNEDRVFFVKKSETSGYDIVFQQMQGGQISLFANTPKNVNQMFYVAEHPYGNGETLTLYPEMILALNEDNNVVKVTKDKTVILNDIKPGDLMPGNRIFEPAWMAHAPQKGGNFTMYFGRLKNGKATGLALVPSDEESPDIAIRNDRMQRIYNREMNWIDPDKLVVLAVYPKGTTESSVSDQMETAPDDAGEENPDTSETFEALDEESGGEEIKPEPGELETVVEKYELNMLVHMTAEERKKFNRDFQGKFEMNAEDLFKMDSLARGPATTGFFAKTLPYFVFEYLDENNVWQIAFSDYQRAKVLTDGEGDRGESDISRDADLIAFEATLRNGRSAIVIYHVPSMTKVFLNNPQKISEKKMNLGMPRFSPTRPYALSYMYAFDAEDPQPQVGVINLEFHPVIGPLISQYAASSYSIDHILTNDAYPDVAIPSEQWQGPYLDE